jgi:hypothetical protein
MARGVPASRKASTAAQPAQRSIALDLAPLIAPYKKEGRLSLRVENLPQGTRLSRGSRNNERSWSLASDELEDLFYLLPDGATKPHKLALRIVSLANGNTLAVIEIAIDPEAAQANAAAPPTPAAAPQQDDAELERLRDALTKAEAELGDIRAKLKVQTPARDTDAELAAAHAVWQKDLDRQLAHAAAARKAEVAEVEARWKTELGAARAAWQREAADSAAQAKAGAVGQADEVKRLREEAAALAAKARDEAAARLAESEAAWKAKLAAVEAQARATETAALKLRDEAVAKAGALTSKVAACETAVTEALAKAEDQWKKAEAERSAATETRWKEMLAKTVAEARAATPPPPPMDDGALKSLRAALAVAEAERDAARREVEAARTKADALSTALAARDASELETLAKAEAAWKAAEAERLARTETLWKETTTKAVAEARAQLVAPPPPPPVVPDDTELKRLRTALVAAEAERDTARREGEAALAKAEAAWRQKLADAKPATAEPASAKELRATITDLQTKLDERDAALLQARRESKGDAFAQREMGMLRAKVERLESELAAAVPARRNEQHNSGQPFRVREMLVKAPDEKAPANNRMVRDIAIAGALGIAAVVYFYPEISGMVFGPPPAPVVEKAPAVEPPPAPTAPLEEKARTARDAKLREAPSTSSVTLAKLAKGAEVVIVERQDKWTKVRFTAKPGEPPREGWVSAPLLERLPPTAPK